jgi:hypothetical protein
VSAFIEDNMFLIGMGVDGCGNIHRFLEPNRGGVFTDENFNADAIIWCIIDNRRLDYLYGLNLNNLIALHAALNREIDAAERHPLILSRLIDRRDEIANRVRAIDAYAATPERYLERVRDFTYNDFLDYPAPARWQLRERAAFTAQANRVLADAGIPLGQRRDLRGNLEVRGLRGLYNPVRAAVLNIAPEEDGAAIREHFAREANPELEQIVREGVEAATRDGIEIPIWARAVVDGATERERERERERREEAASSTAATCSSSSCT